MLDSSVRLCFKVLGLAICVGCVCALAELADRVAPAQDHPAIRYTTSAPHDPVSELDRKLASSDTHLKFEGASGYLRSVLDALNVPIESQIAVFSQTSLQADLIQRNNPRTIFFNDSVVVAWMRRGLIELASHDPVRGVIF